MKSVIDMRSDVVTRPTDEMRQAMYEAEVGNDGSREDPTTERLQELAADRLGKESALFVTSGTQGNLLATLSQLERGGVLIAAENSHVEYAERNGYTIIAGATLESTRSERGVPIPAEIRAALKRTKAAPSRLIWLENTHNLGGGTAVSVDVMKAIADLAAEFRVPVHVDGSRIFNAATYLGVDASELTADADTVQFCLSKGLAAPVGSILAGPSRTINRAREIRQMIGGQMRQVGVIAAAGIVALETMTLRLQEDHENARALAEGLVDVPGIEIDPLGVQTNLLYCYVKSEFGDAAAVLARLREAGVLAGGGGLGAQSIRFVTHYEITRADINSALKVTDTVMRESQRSQGDT